jgi:hypothetical protein
MARRPAKRYRPKFHDIIATDAAWRRYLETGNLPSSGIEIKRLPGVRSSPEVRSERESIRSWIEEDRREDLSAAMRVHVMAQLKGHSQAEIGREVGKTRRQVHQITVSWRESLNELRKDAPKGELDKARPIWFHRT